MGEPGGRSSTSARVLIRLAGRPPLLNAERSGHWREHRARTRMLRGETALRVASTKLGTAPGPVEVFSWPTYRSGQSWPDVAAWAPATKAVIDGFVDAGYLAGDTPDVVARSTFEQPQPGDRDELLVLLLPQVSEISAGQLAKVLCSGAVEVGGSR